LWSSFYLSKRHGDPFSTSRGRSIVNWLENKLEISHGSHKALLSMEGLRGVAVFLVFLVHYCTQMQPYIREDSFAGDTLVSLHRLGNVGVDLFFVLSGFLIYGMLMKKPETHFFPYLKRRVVRIYPTFLAVFAVYLLLSYYFPGESKLPECPEDARILVVQNLLLLPGIFDIPAIITVAWSLSYELFYYLFIPAIIGSLSLRRWPYQYRIALWCVAMLISVCLLDYYGGPSRLGMFIPGILLYELCTYTKLSPPKYTGTACLLLVVLLFIFKGVIGFGGVMAIFILGMLFFLLCFEAFTRLDGSASWLIFRPLRWLGNMSYSYYLFHGLTLKAAFLIMSKVVLPNNQYDSMFWWALLPAFTATLVTSFLLFLYVESPFSLVRKK